MTVFHYFTVSITRFFVAFFSILITSSASAQLPCGQTIDFNTWSQEGLLASGAWTVGGGGSSVNQTINGQPTWFISPNDFIDVLIQGSIQVNTGIDDDMVGFVFGYQSPIGVMANPASTYTKSFFFDWKRGTQVYQGMTSYEGFALFEVDGFYNYNAPFYNEFWERVNTPFMTVLDTDYGNNGWNSFQQYDFQLKYTTDSIVIWIDGVRIFEEGGCFEPGKFGFYNFSQSVVNYSNFSYNIEYDFDVSDTLICLGDTSFFEIGAGCATNFPATMSFDWSFDDGTTSSGVDPFHIYNTAGVYQTTLISSDPIGCSDSSFQTIEVMDYPVVDAGPDDISCDFTYTLNASGGGGQWQALNGGQFTDMFSPTCSVTVPAAGTYSFVWEVSNLAGCSASDTVSINFSEPSITQVSVNPSCSGVLNGSISLLTSGGVQPITYQWDSAAGNQTTSSAVNLGGGTFSVIVTDSAGCFVDTSFSLTAPAPLSFSLDVLPSDCDVNDGVATVSSMSGGTAPYFFDWGAGQTSNNASNGLASGAYTLIITDNAGCDSSVTFDILNNPFIVNTNVQHISCFGLDNGEANVIVPSPSASYTYMWGASSNNQTTQTATNLSPGNHEVTVTSSGGCSETLTVAITEPPVLLASTTDISVCQGELITIAATAFGGTPAYQYNWVNASGQAQNPVDIVVAQSETYTVTVTDANNCSVSDSVIVTALEVPIASFVVDQVEACEIPQHFFNFENVSVQAGGTIDWDFGDGSFGSGDLVSHAYDNLGTYTVSVTVVNANGCSDSYTEPNMITILPSPTADFTFSPEVISSVNPNVQFIDLSFDDISAWNWSFGNLGTSTAENPSYSFDDEGGEQVVELEVENIYGCIDSTSRLLEVRQIVEVYAPNAFTPDGNEFNQSWRMYLVGLDVFDVEINIYNRWGERVWQSFDVEVPWDGTYNGQIVPGGVYTWTLRAGDMNTDENYERVGHVTVLR